MIAPHSIPAALRPAAIVALALLGGCFYPADRGRALETRVQSLEGENHALRNRLEQNSAQLQATLPRIDEKIAEVSRALQTLDKASRRSNADASVVLQRNVEDVATLRGQMETYLHQLEELRTQLQTEQAQTEQKLIQMMGPEAVKAWEARKKLDDLERPTEPRAYFSLAASKARAADPAVARKLYDEFLQKWPKHELAGEAHFGLGELFYKDDRCREALGEYLKVLQGYPKTKSAPDAYLHSADCFGKLKMNAEAKQTLEELVKKYPTSNAAKLARTKLKKGKK